MSEGVRTYLKWCNIPPALMHNKRDSQDPAFFVTRRFVTVSTTALPSLLFPFDYPIHTLFHHDPAWFCYVCTGVLSGLISSGFPTKSLYATLISHTSTTCPTYRAVAYKVFWDVCAMLQSVLFSVHLFAARQLRPFCIALHCNFLLKLQVLAALKKLVIVMLNHL
jgi:hypothetical protein